MASTDPASAPTWLPPVVAGDRSVRAPGPRLAAVEFRRVEQGFTVDGLDHPRDRWWLRAVLPLGAADGVAVAALIGTGSVLAGVAVLALTAATAGLAVLVHRDPLRINRSDRRELADSRVWRSANDWVPPLSETPERAQLEGAVQAVGRIVATACWWREVTAPARLALDLFAELDEVDAQAFGLAGLGAADPSRVQLRETLEHRVKALAGLAEEAERQDRLSAASVPAATVPPMEAVVGGVRDEYATDRVVALTQALRDAAP